MQYHDILLPDFISIHLKGGPVFATTMATMISGREIRAYGRQQSMQKYTISGCKLSNDEFERFNSFFRARLGCAYAFRVKDHADFKIENEVLAIGNGAQKSFEIFKKYADEVSHYQRKIVALREQSIIADYEIERLDRESGTIYTTIPVENGKEFAISGEFDIWVRFMSDEFNYS